MKKIIFFKSLRITTVILTMGMLTFGSCGNGNDDEKPIIPSGPLEVTISGNISHTTHTPDQSGTVTLTRFPATVNEFKQVREQIGGEPHGAVALQIMAFEMYRRNKKIGEECIRLNSLSNTVTSSLARLNELFGKDANYARPYQMAAHLKGATPENGYNPTKPYTIEVKVNNGKPYQHSDIYQTEVLYLRVITNGRDSGTNGIDVLKTYDPNQSSEGKYFIIFACSDLYSQVKAISFTTTFNGLD